MEIINNIDRLLGDDLKNTIEKNSKLSIVASCFSIYAYEALKKELEQIEKLRFIFEIFKYPVQPDFCRKCHIYWW